MIKLFSLKQQKKDGDQTARGGQQKKASAAQLRIQKGKSRELFGAHDFSFVFIIIYVYMHMYVYYVYLYILHC